MNWLWFLIGMVAGMALAIGVGVGMAMLAGAQVEKEERERKVTGATTTLDPWQDGTAEKYEAWQRSNHGEN